jgi:hypothetical protein
LRVSLLHESIEIGTQSTRDSFRADSELRLSHPARAERRPGDGGGGWAKRAVAPREGARLRRLDVHLARKRVELRVERERRVGVEARLRKENGRDLAPLLERHELDLLDPLLLQLTL